MKLLIFYFAIINIVAFLMMGYDKTQAKTKQWRVPERRLFAIAAVGGGVGAWLGMMNWRHKTKHASFVYGIPALIALNAVEAWLLVRYVLEGAAGR